MQLLHNLVDSEARRLLSRRKLLERREKLTDSRVALARHRVSGASAALGLT